MQIETFKTRLDETIEKLFGKGTSYDFSISSEKYINSNGITAYTNRLYININEKLNLVLYNISYSDMFVTALRMLNTCKSNTRNKYKSIEVKLDTHVDSQFGE